MRFRRKPFKFPWCGSLLCITLAARVASFITSLFKHGDYVRIFLALEHPAAVCTPGTSPPRSDLATKTKKSVRAVGAARDSFPRYFPLKDISLLQPNDLPFVVREDLSSPDPHDPASAANSQPCQSFQMHSDGLPSHHERQSPRDSRTKHYRQFR
ncbi:hypothetical protein CPB85DRAFT_1255891 [Mucidula mucida]|nr:hypothetical protein CPB85DRAFT_1255891 [Mucidula mucida]